MDGTSLLRRITDRYRALGALKREGRGAASKTALSEQCQSKASRRPDEESNEVDGYWSDGSLRHSLCRLCNALSLRDSRVSTGGRENRTAKSSNGGT